MRFRKLIAGAVACGVAAMAGGVAAAAQATPQSHPIRVAFINPGKSDETYWTMVTQTMVAAGRRFGIEVETLYSGRNFRRMQELGLEVVARETKPDYLILSNEDAAAAPIMQAADEAGIKTFLISSSLDGPDAERLGPPRTKLKGWIGSLVPDIDEAGARMARQLIDMARRNKLAANDGMIHLLAIGGDEITPVSTLRMQGMLRAVAAAPDVVIDRILYANWNATEAEQLAHHFLAWADRRGIKTAGIWAGNDPMALGALKAVSARGLKPGADVFIAGLNWSPEALERVEAGELLLTDGGHFLVGAWSMILLRDYVDGCDFAKDAATIRFRTAAVTRDKANFINSLVGNGAFERIDVQSLRAARQGICGHYDFSIDALVGAVIPQVDR